MKLFEEFKLYENMWESATSTSNRKIIYVLSTFAGEEYIYDDFYDAVDDAENCTEATSVYPYYLEADGSYSEMVPDWAPGYLCWTDEEDIIEEKLSVN